MYKNNLKTHYCAILVNHIVHSIEDNFISATTSTTIEGISEISFLKVVQSVDNDWRDLSLKT